MNSEPPAARPDPLTITFVDANYLPLLELWLPRLAELGVERVKVFCLDTTTLAWCRSRGVAAAQVEWAGNLRDLWAQRIRVFSELLATGQEFIHSDIDAIWIRNPLLTGSAVGCDEDLVFSQGTVWPPDVHAQWGFVLCCGWFRARPTLAAQAFFQGLELDVRQTGDDQISVNRLLSNLGAQWSHGRTGEYQLGFRERVVQCWTQTVRAQTTAGPLSVALLPQREFQRLPEDSEHAIIKHYLTPKSCGQKLDALREYGLI
jgi:hypothetical protein